jgi:hypothetical protein
MKPVHRIKADLDPEREKSPESPMNAGTERNPFLWSFRACAASLTESRF